MPPIVSLLLVPRVVLLPPDAPDALDAVAESCATSFASSPELETVRLAEAPAPGTDLGARVQPDLDAAGQAYRQLHFRDAAGKLESVIAILQGEATTPGDFTTLFHARVRLGMALLALHRSQPAGAAFEAAIRGAPDDRLSEGDYSPAVIAAFEEARTRVAGEPRHRLVVAARGAIAGVEPAVAIDGRSSTGDPLELAAGAHVVHVTAPGHSPVRTVVSLPRSEPLSVVLPAAGAVPSGVVVALSVSPTAGGVRVVLRPAGSEQMTEETDLTNAPAAARRLADRLASRLGGAPPVISTSSPPVRTAVDPFETPARSPRRRSSGSGSILGRWWFWTIVGGVAVVAVVGAAAASRGDPGTDVHVGVQ